ncbi:MAG TPA: glutathione S-transferase family protein [Gaiellaceae bacterium]|jgi:glutathione S-transferase|nr:glutathione S-transferase family protein [Gaiellaceae bacterium]
MAVVLYDSAVSGNCYKVRLLFALLGVEYERRELSVVDKSNREEELGALNPGLRVPTVVLDDGRPLGESGAILWYFGDGTQYVPRDPYDRAKALQWMFFEQYSHEPYIAVARNWLMHDLAPSPEALAERQRGGYVALDALERGLADGSDFLAGGFSIADIALYAYTHVAREGGFDVSGYPSIQAWIERVSAQPGYVPITA